MGRSNTALTAVTLTVLVGLGVSACGADDDSDSSAEFAPQFAPEFEVGAPTDDASNAGRTGAVERPESTGDAAEQAARAVLPTGQALATTAGVVVATSDIRAAVADTLAAVQRNGASVFTADVEIGDERDDGSVNGSGYFVVKVAPADLEPLIADLGATVGRLSGRTQDTTDVTDQLVDLDIRIGVERDVITRFRSLLTDATEFQDIVEIERVISERTIALEQLLASQRTLENRVDRSTLTIQLRYEPPVAEIAAGEDDPIESIGDAWRTGWDVFVGALFAIGFVLAVAAPFVLAALLVFGVVWLAIRRVGRTRPNQHHTKAVRAPGAVVEPAGGGVTPDEQLAGPTPGG
jgi:uncharacterized membrane protein